VANCLATAQTWPVSYQALPGGFTTQPRLTTLCNDLNNGLAGVKLFPVFDNGPSYHVIGWAAGTYTVATTFQSGQTGQAPNVCTATPLPPPIPPPGVLTDITLNITFQAFNLSSTSLPTGGGAEPTDFGVRAIALTG